MYNMGMNEVNKSDGSGYIQIVGGCDPYKNEKTGVISVTKPAKIIGGGYVQQESYYLDTDSRRVTCRVDTGSASYREHYDILQNEKLCGEDGDIVDVVNKETGEVNKGIGFNRIPEENVPVVNEIKFNYEPEYMKKFRDLVDSCTG